MIPSMALRNMTLSDVDRLGLDADADRAALTMDEDAFRGFYDRTARALWAYLARATGDATAADDLLQECYYRLLRARVEFDGEAHRRHYLFRVATNLVRDGRRRPSREQPFPEGFEDGGAAETASLADALDAKRDVGRALGALRPRDRALLWFAYAQGLTHVEIAESIGVKPTSVRLLLFRARTRLAAILGRAHGGRV
jgi:RNA polymerase sigma-70 factor (ECF subfamily)